jgi:hypothetical protein
MGIPKLTLRRIRDLGPPVYAHLEDYSVLEAGEVIGRIYESREKYVPEFAWFWSITSMRRNRNRQISSPRCGASRSTVSKSNGSHPLPLEIPSRCSL